MEGLALLASRRGDDDRDVACRLGLPKAQHQSPGLVAEQHYVEQNRRRLHAPERTLRGGDGARDDWLIVGAAEKPLHRETVGEIVIDDQNRDAAGINQPLLLSRFDRLGGAVYARYGHGEDRTLPRSAVDRDTAAQQFR